MDILSFTATQRPEALKESSPAVIKHCLSWAEMLQAHDKACLTDKMNISYLVQNHFKYSAKYLISFLFGLVLSGFCLGLSNLAIFTVLFFNVLQLDLLERAIKSLHTHLR